MVPARKGSKYAEILFYFVLLTGFFLLLEISYFIQCNRYLADFTFVSENIKIPLTILPGITFFVAAQLLVHFAYCFFVWLITILTASLLRIPEKKILRFGIFIWSLGIAIVLVSNQYLFSNSKFSELTSLILFNPTLTKGIWIILVTVGLLFTFIASVELAKRLCTILSLKSCCLLLFLVVPSFTFIFLKGNPVVTDGASEEKPNLIIIGVDSLRPDFLSYFGNNHATPFIDSFLEQSTVFAEAVTPLARTFPSWAIILSGQYPKENGIRTNLQSLKTQNFNYWLPTLLKQHGYATMFATDETRFSNMDHRFGFDRIISPPIGLNDFLLGTFNDFPLSNFVINTRVGKWLFPYSYANRPVYPSYDPDTFLEFISPALQQPRSKPLFLAIHFCLTHYPYLWGSLPGNNLNILERYQASIARVDKQLNDFFQLLQQSNLLKHAIVVLLSDHGEALELQGDRITERDLYTARHKIQKIPQFYPPSLDDEDINQSAGHGGDVLGLPQYHTLLAFRLYGLGTQKRGINAGVVTLLDVKPTLLHLIGLPAQSANGYSLAAVISGKGEVRLDRHVFLESDISPEAIRTVYPEVRKVILEGIELFQIDPISTRLTVKQSMADMIVNSKQYADIYGTWILALYPQNNRQRMPILVNLANGQWTNDLHSEFAKNSPAKTMLAALKKFYGTEINTIIYEQ